MDIYVGNPPNPYRFGGAKIVASDSRYQTIAAALAAATSGDLVIISPGTYNESNLQIPVGVNIYGFGPSTYLHKTSGAVNTMLRPLGNNIIKGMKIVNDDITSGGYCVGGTSDDASLAGKTVTIEDCEMSSNWDTVWMNTGAWTLRNCRIIGTYDVLRLNGPASVTAIRCQFSLPAGTGVGNAFLAGSCTSDDATATFIGCTGDCTPTATSSVIGVVRVAASAANTLNYYGYGNSWSANVSAYPCPVRWFVPQTSLIVNLYSLNETFSCIGATSAPRLYYGNNSASRLEFHGGNAASLTSGQTTNASIYFAPDGPGYTVIEELVDLTGNSAKYKALTTAIPSGAVIISVQANIDAAVTGGGTTAKVGIGTNGVDPDAYGLSADLAQNTQINNQIAQASLTELGGDTTLEVCGCTAAGALGDTNITAGKVFVRIVYRKIPMLRTI